MKGEERAMKEEWKEWALVKQACKGKEERGTGRGREGGMEEEGKM